jgi:hypothetical protein
MFSIIPLGQNERFMMAYLDAVKKLNGDDLINPVISEDWYWAFILDGFTTTVKGDVIKYKK